MPFTLGFLRPAGHDGEVPAHSKLSGHGTLVIVPAGAPATQVLRECLKELLGQEGWPVGAAIRVVGGTPCIQTCLLPLPLPRGGGLQVGVHPTIQPQCRELPHTEQTPCSPPQGTGCVLACREGSFWVLVGRAGQSASGGRCGLEKPLGGTRAKSLSQGPQRAGADGLGPEVLNDHQGVCPLWEGVGKCCPGDLQAKEECH